MVQLPHEFPLRAGPVESFARVRQVLHESGFDEVTLCRELKLPSLGELGRVRWQDPARPKLPEVLHHWAGVFLFGERVPRAPLEQLTGGETLEEFLSLGLLQVSKRSPDCLVSPVFLYPVAGFLIASDRYNDPDGEIGVPREAMPDVVLPAIFGGTLRFLELLPDAGNGDALDLCGGSGIGALCLGRTARTAVSADITERATAFADFNAQLNNCPSVSARCGDLYSPVAGRQFRCITAHPPYVPALGNRMIYRDGGDAGEDITRGIVAGLTCHLEPGGLALILCQGRDTEEGAFEQRLRVWLGENEQQFDVVFALQITKTPEQEVQELTRRAQTPTDGQAAELLARLRKLGTVQFVYGAVVIQRHTTAEMRPWTFRTRLSAETIGGDFGRLIRWHHFRHDPACADWLAQAQLALSPHFEVNTRHIVHEGALALAEVRFEADRPFSTAMRIDSWVIPLIARFDGERTAGQVYAQAQEEQELPPGFEFKDFLELIALLVERGFLVPPEIPAVT